MAGVPARGLLAPQPQPMMQGLLAPQPKRNWGGLLDYLMQDSIPAQAVKGAWSGLTAVEDAYQGRIPMWGPDGRTSEAAVGRAADLAGTMTLGAGAMPAEANTLRAGVSAPKTEAFLDWFRGSKVVDENGEPLVVFKGMMDPADDDGVAREVIKRSSDFPAFNGTEEGYQIAGFFGADPAVASRFAQHGKGGTGGAVFPVHLNLKKPYVVDAQGGKAGNIQFGSSEEAKAFRKAMKSGDYDGAIIRNTADDGTVYVAKHPEQIKSTHNRGTFDPKDPRIMYSLGAGAAGIAAGSDWMRNAPPGQKVY